MLGQSRNKVSCRENFVLKQAMSEKDQISKLCFLRGIGRLRKLGKTSSHGSLCSHCACLVTADGVFFFFDGCPISKIDKLYIGK